MGNIDELDTAIESLLIEGLAQRLTRRTAERIVADVRRNRHGAPLPRDVDQLRVLVRGELTQATALRLGARAMAAIADVEERLLAMSALPADSWEGPRVRLVYVGQSECVARYLAETIHATEVHRVDELFELLMALDTQERTLVVVDADAACSEGKLDPTALARFVPDFASHVVTMVAGATDAIREAFLRSGGAFRATLRKEPLDHPDLAGAMRDLVSGVQRSASRRSRGGPSTTTQPARAA